MYDPEILWGIVRGLGIEFAKIDDPVCDLDDCDHARCHSDDFSHPAPEMENVVDLLE